MRRQISLPEKVHVWCREATVEGQVQPSVKCFACPKRLRPPRDVYERLRRKFGWGLPFESHGHLEGAEYGHNVAYSHGGASVPENIWLVCPQCNNRMKTQSFDEYCRQMGYTPIKNPEDVMAIYPTATDVNLTERMLTDDLDPWKCKAYTRTGAQCRNNPIPGLDYCHVHSGHESLARDGRL